MLIVNVNVRVKKNNIQDFIDATIKNATQSNKESGITRFDIIQEEDDNQNFMLIEVYNNPDAPAQHKDTKHYKIWRDTVADMMDSPRTNIKYNTIFTKDTNYVL